MLLTKWNSLERRTIISTVHRTSRRCTYVVWKAYESAIELSCRFACNIQQALPFIEIPSFKEGFCKACRKNIIGVKISTAKNDNFPLAALSDGQR